MQNHFWCPIIAIAILDFFCKVLKSSSEWERAIEKKPGQFDSAKIIPYFEETNNIYADVAKENEEA